MSKNDTLALKKAGKIIERFGGIRPMAAKINTPVTTVQGWKKRDVIPGARRALILSVARENDIDISGLVEEVQKENKTAQPKTYQPKKEQSGKKKESVSPVSAPEDQFIPSSPPSPSSVSSQSHADIFAAIEESGRKTMVNSVWIATGLILFSGVVAAFLLWPSAKKIEEQSERLTSLEESAGERTSLFKAIVPENMQEKMDELQNQARNIQTTVQQLSDRANEISSGVLGEDAGPLSSRLEVLEKEMAAFSGSDNNFGELIGRIKTLENTMSGQAQLGDSVNELWAMVEKMGAQDNLEENLAEAQSDDGALGETLEGVSGNDLKAAAMLIAFSQLRESLHREAPFENDLALLQKMAGNENTELQDSLARLAPHANGGVLTADGLSGEFKGLAGDIVVSSLKGEDISFKDKAKARLNNVFQVEKNGELVTGTNTQAVVSKAQALLDEGNIQGAISELQALDGVAAQKAQPFIRQAEVSLLAEKVQQLLGETILSKISGQLPIPKMLQEGMGGIAPPLGMDDSAQPMPPVSEDEVQKFDLNAVTNGLNMEDVKKSLEGAIPDIGGQDVIRDEESGVTILPRQPSFKGFSGGQ